MDPASYQPFGHIGSAEDDAQNHLSNSLKDLPHEMLMGQDLLSLDSGLSLCDDDDDECTTQMKICRDGPIRGDRMSETLFKTSPLALHSQTAITSKAKKNIDFLIDVVTDKLSEEDQPDEYAYVPKTG